MNKVKEGVYYHPEQGVSHVYFNEALELWVIRVDPLSYSLYQCPPFDKFFVKRKKDFNKYLKGFEFICSLL
jgi:hypothetical protein